MNAPLGYAARPLTQDDAPAIADVINLFERIYVEDPDTVGAAEVAGWWSSSDLATDSVAFLAADGALASIGVIYPRGDEVLGLDGWVLPDHQGRGLGSTLVGWLEDETLARGHTVARTSALAVDHAAAGLLAGRGFGPVRRFYRMAVELDSPPPEPAWPGGFEVSTFRSGEEETLRAVIEEAFAEHWGHEERDLDHWLQHTFGAPWWDPSLVYLVREGDEVVAAEVNAVRFGGGWIGTIGTLEPWRGRGLGRALLLEAFGEFHRRGEPRVSLAVDAGNETGATHLYESIGMRVVWQADVYEKRLQIA